MRPNLKLINLSARCARNNNDNMALRVAVRDGVIKSMDRKRLFQIDVDSAKQPWAKANRAPGAITSGDCSSCRHRYCGVCEEYSVKKQYSDYWICHCCGELTLRVSNLH
jgi:hypothetical protein